MEKTKETQNREALFRETYLTCRRPLDFFLRTYCPDEAARSDLVQEIFVNFYKAMTRLDPERPVKPYLYSIARNKGRDWNRSRQRGELPFSGDTEPDTSASRQFNPEDQFFKSRRKEILAEEIAGLKPESRRLLLLYYYENLKIPEISGILGIPGGTVKYRLHRIRKKLASGPLSREVENE